MSVITDYMKKNLDNLKNMQDNNLKKMQELEEQSKVMQTEFNNLNATNAYLSALIAEIENLPKGGNENANSETQDA
jgi:hypothetical protein